MLVYKRTDDVLLCWLQLLAGQSAAELQYLQQQLPATQAPLLQYQSAATAAAAAAAGRLNAHFQSQVTSQRTLANHGAQFTRQATDAAFPSAAQQLCMPSVVLAPGIVPG